MERSIVMDGTQKRKGSPDTSSSAKRSRNDDGNSGSQGGGFEEELAALDFLNDKNPSAKWSRPAVPKLNPLTDDIVFQQLEVDNYIGLYTLVLTSFVYFRSDQCADHDPPLQTSSSILDFNMNRLSLNSVYL